MRKFDAACAVSVSAIVDISPEETDNTQGCYVEVDQSDGEVYVAWGKWDAQEIRARRNDRSVV